VTDRRAVERIIGTIAEQRHLAARLIVEITETAAIKDLAGSIGFVDALKDLGVRVALDDFGSGHTSFLHLRTLRPSIVKIDRNYVRDLGRDPDAALFVGALAQLATGLGARTVAEGVETIAEADALRALGIDMLQGYAIASPGPIQDSDAS
jgi:EAL domain-containing protein (putative c-di-GMP-specific phosphodiesterase class I)